MSDDLSTIAAGLHCMAGAKDNAPIDRAAIDLITQQLAAAHIAGLREALEIAGATPCDCGLCVSDAITARISLLQGK
jgi:hypothetical protein